MICFKNLAISSKKDRISDAYYYGDTLDNKNHPHYSWSDSLHSAQATLVNSLIHKNYFNTMRQEKKIELYNQVTHLPNCQLFIQQCNAILNEESSHSGVMALIVLNLYDFQRTNNVLSRSVGDILLVEITQRLKNRMIQFELLGHLSGGEFTVLMRGADLESITSAIKHLMLDISLPINLPTTSYTDFHLSFNAGVAFIDNQNNQMTPSYLDKSHIALMRAKTTSQNSYCIFDSAMQTQLENIFHIEHALYNSITHNQLILYYQPQVNETGTIIGVEALCRWMHPVNGLIMPDVFIPLAEKNGFILHLGKWVMEQSFAQLTSWAQDEKLSQLTLSINVSAKQLLDPTFIETLDLLLIQYTFERSKVYFEITESVFLEDILSISTIIKILKERRISVSLDDFGTGFSSLSYLKNLAFDEIKIDRSFVINLPHSKRDQAIVSAITSMSNHFNFDIIAEGVETQDQQICLKELGCKRYQGYLYGKAMHVLDIQKIVLSGG